MKQTTCLLVALLICFSVVFSMTACTSAPTEGNSPITITSPKHPIEQFFNKMRSAESAQLTVTMYDLPFFGTVTMVSKHDGNIDYTAGSLISEETYTETLDDVKYKYTKNENGKWTKALSENDKDDSEDSNDFTKLMENPDNFEAVEGKPNTYKQKSSVVFDEVDNVTITIEEESCTIEMMMITEDLTCRCVVVISHIGEIELTLPEVSE